MSGKYKEMIRENVNLNTLLAAVILGISGWTLSEVVGLGKAQVVSATESAQATKDIDALRVRMTAAEAEIAQVRVDLAKLEPRTTTTTTTIR